MMYWAFEDTLKRLYTDFLGVLEAASKDALTKVKETAVRALAELLREKPEQRSRIFGLLVNKLGDTEKRICGIVSKGLCEIVLSHKSMKPVVIDETERFLLRKNLPSRSQYYALLVLNQIMFAKDEGALAARLVSVYLAFFRAASTPKDTKEKKEAKKGSDAKADMDSKVLSAILTGLHRAFPYASISDEAFAAHEDSLFHLVHKSSFNKSVQALQLLLQIMTSRNAVSDRFYSALYGRVMAEDLFTSKKLATFLNLLYKAIKMDPLHTRAVAFIKRMLQVCVYSQPNFIIGFFIILSEIIRQRPRLRAMLNPSWKGDDDDDDEVQQANFVDLDANQKLVDGVQSGSYFPMKRDPRYTNAEKALFWDVVPFTRHCHPTVVKYAEMILAGEQIDFAGDPLQNFTLANFLDRFSFKNPKQKYQSRRRHPDEASDSEDEGSKTLSTQDIHKPSSFKSSDVLPPVNAPASLARKESDIPVEERFFHEFFKLKGSTKALEDASSTRGRRGADDFGGDDEGEDEGEAAVPKAAKAKEAKKGKDDDASDGESEHSYSDIEDVSEGDSVAASDDEEALERMLLDDLSDAENPDGGAIDLEAGADLGDLGEPEEEEGDLQGSAGGRFVDAEEFDKVLASRQVDASEDTWQNRKMRGGGSGGRGRGKRQFSGKAGRGSPAAKKRRA
eukprot:m51a1_g19 putative CCAAT/enhancer-binding protein zeta (676) ;mRNA; f:87089-89620